MNRRPAYHLEIAFGLPMRARGRDRGDLKIGGKVVNDLAPKDGDIAMVFQNYALYPHMTVRDNMGFALKLRKEDPAEINRRVHTRRTADPARQDP